VILGLGTDLVEVARISKSISSYGSKFTQRVFTPAERAYAESTANSAERFAARFAAKEAAMKALGTGWGSGVTWTQIEVSNLPGGRPELLLHNTAREIADKMGVKKIWLTMTHTSQLASAMVIFES
jgi:holo-[acyl-carrier protein] synthase